MSQTEELNKTILLLVSLLPEPTSAELRKTKLELLTELNNWQIKAEVFLKLPSVDLSTTKVNQKVLNEVNASQVFINSDNNVTKVKL